jgi:hypothetical protein
MKAPPPSVNSRRAYMREKRGKPQHPQKTARLSIIFGGNGDTGPRDFCAQQYPIQGEDNGAGLPTQPSPLS